MSCPVYLSLGGMVNWVTLSLSHSAQALDKHANRNAATLCDSTATCVDIWTRLTLMQIYFPPERHHSYMHKATRSCVYGGVCESRMWQYYIFMLCARFGQVYQNA